MIRLKRIYEEASEDDGKRVLVDRIWPRGVSKEEARLDRWMKEIAPSDDLRRWFGHEQEKWKEFARRYREELREPGKTELLETLADWAAEGPVTLLFGAKDEEHNQAVVLADVLAENYGCRRED